MIEFNRGNALFKNRDQEQALDRYLAALATDDPALASRAKYNIGVIKYRQALAAAQRYEDALTLAQAAIGYFRDSLRLDAGHADARYNLELAYRFHYRLEQELLHAQRNAASPEDKASLRRGQALSDKIRNEGSGQRDARPDLDRRPHGQRANAVPENYSNNEEKSKPPEMARLPVAMSSDGAQQLMEQLRKRLEARPDPPPRAAAQAAAAGQRPDPLVAPRLRRLRRRPFCLARRKPLRRRRPTGKPV